MEYSPETTNPTDISTPVCVRGLISTMQSMRRNRPKTVEAFEKLPGVKEAITFESPTGRVVRMECRVEDCEAGCIVGHGFGQQGHGLYVNNFPNGSGHLLEECIAEVQAPVIDV